MPILQSKLKKVWVIKSCGVSVFPPLLSVAYLVCGHKISQKVPPHCIHVVSTLSYPSCCFLIVSTLLYPPCCIIIVSFVISSCGILLYLVISPWKQCCCFLFSQISLRSHVTTHLCQSEGSILSNLSDHPRYHEISPKIFPFKEQSCKQLC